ncbi:MAG TPA: fibronectin type III domain-containing protein, partial [Candidatus Sumerlaeota bacterium]|nr:fibronectin type III domain-containing protein [Candidatus Sumerlaeota bacterium]
YTVEAANKVFTAKFRALPAQLAAPTNVQATVDTSSYLVKLTWNAVADATHYEVLRAVAGGEPTSVAFGDWITGTSFADDSVVPGVSYQYSVKASMNAGERASEASAPVTGRAKADPAAVAANYKVTYTKNMPLQKVVTNGVAALTFNATGVANASIKITLLKKLPAVTTDDAAKGIAYLLNVSEVTNLTIIGDVKVLSVAAPVYTLTSNGLIKSLTATAPVSQLAFKEAGMVKLSATKDSSVPFFARTRITGGNGASALSLLTTGVVIEDLSSQQAVKALKVAAKAYKTAAGVKTTSLGAIGLAQDLDSKAGVVSDYTANGPSVVLMGGVAGVTKTLVSATGGSIVVDSLEGCLDKIMVSGGDIRCLEILSNNDIKLLQAKAKKVAGGALVGGRLGTLHTPDAMTVWAKTNLLSIVGDAGISGRFVAGYAFAGTTPAANYTGAIKTITAKTGAVIEGDADMAAAYVAKLKFKPAKPAETQFAIHTAANQE